MFTIDLNMMKLIQLHNDIQSNIKDIQHQLWYLKTS